MSTSAAVTQTEEPMCSICAVIWLFLKKFAPVIIAVLVAGVVFLLAGTFVFCWCKRRGRPLSLPETPEGPKPTNTTKTKDDQDSSTYTELDEVSGRTRESMNYPDYLHATFHHTDHSSPNERQSSVGTHRINGPKMQKNLPHTFSVTGLVCGQTATQYVELNGTCHSCPLGVFQTLAPERRFEEPRIQVEESLEKDFVSLLVSGRLEITANNLEPVTFAAYKNKLGLLLRECEDLYLGELSTSTCLKLWIIGNDHGCDRLTKQASRLIDDSFEDIAGQDEFCHIDKHRVKDLIEDPYINITSLHSIHNAILRWGNYDSGSRKWERDELMQHFQKTISGNPLFYHSLREECNNNNNSNNTSRIRRVSSIDYEPDSFDSPDVCYRGVCCQSSSKELSVFEVTVENGNLSLELKLDTPCPKELNRNSSFSYSQDNECIYGTEGSKVWYHRPGAKSWKELTKVRMDRTHLSVCSAQGQLFALGGYDNHLSNPTHSVFTYKKDKWVRKVKGCKLELTKGVHSCRCVTNGSLIYIFGVSFTTTADGKQTQTQSLQKIDTSKPGLSELLPTPPYAIEGIIASCVGPSLDGKVYVISSRRDVLEYDPKNYSYTALPPMPKPRSSFGAFFHEHSLYVFGGELKDTSANLATQCISLNLSNTNVGWRPCGFLSQPISILS